MILGSFRTNQALHANRDGNSYSRVAFRELHLDKNIWIIAFKKLY